MVPRATLGRRDFALLASLAKYQLDGDDRRPLNLDQLASALGLSAAFLSTRLRKLEEQGWVERVQRSAPSGRVVMYRPRSGALVRWISTDERVALEWITHGEVDWEFPLVSQVPEDAARQTLYAFLRSLRRRDILHPRMLDGPAEGVLHRAEHSGLTVVVYGSTARGAARTGSDVDALVFESGRQEAGVEPLVIDAAAEVSLAAPRPIQVKVLRVDEAADLPPWIASAVEREGLVIYDGLRTRLAGGATKGVWSFVYGKRLIEPKD